MPDSQLMKLFLQYRDSLFAFILALVRDHDLAEEIFQDVGVAVLNEAAKGTVPANFQAWVRGLARHRAIDYYRRRARQNTVPIEPLAEVIAQAFDEHEPAADDTHERLKHLRECLTRLTGRARTIIDARYKDRLSLRDIAASLHWQEDSIKVALSRARRVLVDCVSRKLRVAEGP